MTSQSFSEAGLTLIRNPALRWTQAAPLYETRAKNSSPNLRKEMQRRVGRARLSWEWKGGPRFRA